MKVLLVCLPLTRPSCLKSCLWGGIPLECWRLWAGKLPPASGMGIKMQMSHTVSWYFLFVSCNQGRNLSYLKREGVFQGPGIGKEKLTEPKKHDKVTLPWPQAFKEWTAQDRPSVGPLHLGRSPTTSPGHSIWCFMKLGAPSRREGLLWVKWPLSQRLWTSYTMAQWLIWEVGDMLLYIAVPLGQEFGSEVSSLRCDTESNA